MDSTATGSLAHAPAAPPAGLSTAEAEQRRRAGEGNAAVAGGTRTYARILRTNVFNFYNTILFVIGATLLALGRYNDALVSVGLGLINAALSAVQEIRAKRKLDHLQLLNQGVVHVLRDGTKSPSRRSRWSGTTCCACAPATRSSSTARWSRAGWRSTSRC